MQKFFKKNSHNTFVRNKFVFYFGGYIMAKSRRKRQTELEKNVTKTATKAIRGLPVWLQILILGAILLFVFVGPKLFPKTPVNQDNLATIENAESTGYQAALNKDAYEIFHDNKPEFSEDEISTEGYIELSELDSLGRCGPALACLGPETLPTEKRGDISSVKPTGWHTIKYPNLIKDQYLFNRCHLIGYQLSGLNAEKRNLITGTRYLNVEGMLPFEDMVANYIKSTGNHVMYRVTPVFNGNELVARGVIMEAYSVEDDGEGVSYNVYCYNTQPGILIDYGTGESAEEE